MSERGFFAIDRSVWDHPLFAREKFSEREAWIWLISSAAWEPMKVRVGRRWFDLARGQCAFALRFLAAKWMWSEPRVRRFLKRLTDDAAALVSATREATLITICNYNDYQLSRRTDVPTSDAAVDVKPTNPRRKEEETKQSNNQEIIKEEALPAVALRAREQDRPIEPIPKDFQLTEAQVARCRADADDATIAERFDKFMNHHTEGEGLSDDWPGVWDRWWPKNKLPRAKPRLVMDSNTDGVPKKKRERGGPIPPAWKPNAAHAALAIAHGLDLAEIEQGFRDGCAAKGYRYLDHDAAFRNWIKNQNTFKRGSGNGIRQNEAAGRGSIVNAADRAIENLEREIAADNEAREGLVLSLPSQRL
jgi:hypothetical protein